MNLLRKDSISQTNSKNKKISTNSSEFNLLSSNQNDNLFDSVLNQVQQKNLEKKRKKNSNNKTVDNINNNLNNISKLSHKNNNQNVTYNEKLEDYDEDINNLNNISAYNTYKENKNRQSNCDDILDENYAKNKKKELALIKPTYNELLEKEISLAEYNNKNNKNKSNKSQNNYFNDFNLINDEEIKYPVYKKKNDLSVSPDVKKKSVISSDKQIKDLNKE